MSKKEQSCDAIEHGDEGRRGSGVLLLLGSPVTLQHAQLFQNLQHRHVGVQRIEMQSEDTQFPFLMRAALLIYSFAHVHRQLHPESLHLYDEFAEIRIRFRGRKLT
jgi:hypothetical protein